MELGKHERETSAKGTLWKEKQKPPQNGEPTETPAVKESSSLRFLYREQVPSESGFLRFTFVPTFGRLPSQFHVVDASSFLVRVSEDPFQKKNQDIRNTTEVIAEGRGIESGPKRNSEASGCRWNIHKHLQPQECNASKGKMDKDDLFQADFVFVTDSDEDKTKMADNSYGRERSQISDTSHVSTRSKSRGNASQQPHTELFHSSTSQQKQCQFTSPLSTSGHPSHKSPIAHSHSPTNLKVEPDLSPTLQQASSVQESHSQWQSANGSTTHQSSTYLQSATSYSVPFSTLKRPPFPFNSLSDSVQSCRNQQTSNLHKISESTVSPLPSKDLPPSSQISSSSDTLQSPSPHTLSPPPPKRFNTLASVPIYITTHLLSPSPKPLSSPFHGSSSTICSVNNPCSHISSRETSGIRSPLPTRLSFLTAILKSGSSPKRPFSPASCPATFSPNSLGSSTLTIDQKFQTTPPTPKKLASNYSVRSDSPGQDEYLLSVFSNVPNHMTLSSKSSPTVRARSVSPKRYLDARELYPDKLRPLSPTISSYRKTVVSPLLQPVTLNSSLPPHVPRNTSQITSKGAHSPVDRYLGPEKSKRVHTYSPTFTAKSYPVSTPTSNQQDTLSPTSEKYPSLSSTFLQPTCKSKACFPQVSAKDLNGHSPVPSPHWPFYHKGSTSPTSQDYSTSSPSVQINSSSIHANYRACPSSSRPRTPLTQPKSPTRVCSPCSLLSRSREMTSPLPSDSKIPQPHKIKASYKAFAAIPTNTLLLEQKALNEPEGEERTLDTHSEICSPAQLRQQTEELCAAIDEVLQDPLSTHQRDSSPSSLQNLLASDIGKTSTALQRPAGRETRFANLSLLTPTVNESKKTRPGVIRPTTVKAKIIFKQEDPIQPNPFKKYLEETTESQTEQESSLSHPFFHTKPNFPTKSPLYPQVISHADLLTPGPFSHLGSIFGDTYDNSYSPYRHNALYNKPTHPIVPIPENEALSSKELHSARIQSKAHLPPHQENKDQSRGSFADCALPHSRAPCLLRGDPGDFPAKLN
ncbi:muscular LMNA-interacting protein isoform X2 [Eublepharis macularius]|uniref:Muscular LMNA-interacting protein isoform X2 n=1 Tax=Eublepharis macularius TaxID=481883 RepID=A0AA97L2D6_EUBMA|nr:muscular LMNA-interacting protein isoform X2 [Eublepharis macularius]